MQAQLASLSASYESAQAALNSSGQALAQKEADAAGGGDMEEGLAWLVCTGWLGGWGGWKQRTLCYNSLFGLLPH